MSSSALHPRYRRIVEKYAAHVRVTLKQTDQFSGGFAIVLRIGDTATFLAAVLSDCPHVCLKAVAVRAMWFEFCAVSKTDVSDTELTLVALTPLVADQ